MKILSAALFTTLLNIGLAQTTTIIVADSISSSKLSDANITYYDKLGNYSAVRSTENGTVNLNLTEISDSIIISHVGYISKTILITTIKENSTIHLIPYTKELDEIIVGSKIVAGTQKIGKFGNTRTNMFSYHFKPCGMTVSGLDSNYFYKIKSISIGLRLSNNCSNGISINFFNTNENGVPQLQDYNGEIIITPEEINSDPFIIDLTKYNIYIDEKSFFFSAHLISYKDCNERKRMKGFSKGTCFKNYKYENETIFWAYNHKRKTWGQQNFFPENTNPALGIELIKYKK
jgi:hypothetical protein